MFPLVLTQSFHSGPCYDLEACSLTRTPLIPSDQQGLPYVVKLPVVTWLTVGEVFCGVSTFMIWVVPSILRALCLILGMTWNFPLC